MFTVIIIMFAGIGLGRVLRTKPLRRLGLLTNALIWVLLFLLGVEVGTDERIVNGLATSGADAVAIAVASVAGSTLFAWGLWRFSSRNRNKRDTE